MLIDNNFDLTQTVGNNGVINFRELNVQFNPIVTSLKGKVVENDTGDYLIIRLGADFISTFSQAPPPKFILDGNTIPFIPKQNISEINPVQGTVEFLTPPTGILEAYVSTIFMSLQDEGKQLTATIHTAQSVLEAWEMNEIADKLNNTIIDNGDNTFNGNFKNLKPLTVDNLTDTFELTFKGSESVQTSPNNVEVNLDKLIVNETDTNYEYLANKVISEDTSIITSVVDVAGVDKLNLKVADRIQNLIPPIGLIPTINYNINLLNNIITWNKTTEPFLVRYNVITSINILKATTYNMVLNLGSATTVAYNINASEFNLQTPNVIQFPNINRYTSYTITIRLTGTLDGVAQNDSVFYIKLLRADNTVITSQNVVRVIENSLESNGVNLSTYTVNSLDNFITDGVKIVIDNTSASAVKINLTGFDILIKGI